MKKAFPNAIIRTHYGQAEGVSTISQDIEGNWNVDMNFAITEFIPVDAANPSICHIVGTNICTTVFPLIHYDTGDIAEVEWNGSEPKVIRIDGRQDDYISLPNGTRIGLLTTLFLDKPNIKEAQVYQPSIEKIVLRVVKFDSYSQADENKLLFDARERFGNDVDISIDYINEIPRTKAGKFKVIVSDVQKPSIQ